MSMLPSYAPTDNLPADMIVLVPSPGEYQDCGGSLSLFDIILYGCVGYAMYRLIQIP
jgi:hypothetical protein